MDKMNNIKGNTKTRIKSRIIIDEIRNSNEFDVDFYRSEYPDVSMAGMDPITHYVLFGANERRKPAFWFDPDEYITAVGKDVVGSDNPFWHYVRHGKKSGFVSCISMENRAVQKENKVVDNVLDLATERGLEYFRDVTPPALTERHLANSRILPSREAILPLMPKDGICAEIGTHTGWFAKLIHQAMMPRKLHLIDLTFEQFDSDYFRDSIAEGNIILHEGDSSVVLADFPNEYFDFIYLDGDHRYSGIRNDLLVAISKIKTEGFIACNDYTIYSPLEDIKYGIYKAVNEICLEYDFEIAYMGLHYWGYHDVAIRKMR